MTDDGSDFSKKLQDKFGKFNEPYLIEEQKLKNSINLNFYFQEILISLIAENEKDIQIIRSYQLKGLDNKIRNTLKAKIKTVMDDPTRIGSYQLGITFNRDEADALRSAKTDGLIALGMLGEIQIIPILLSLLKEENSSSRTRIIVGAVLRDLTKQDIGGYILSNRDLYLWEEWWEQNKSSYKDD